ncbi:hypothetical protein K525DRAFT_363758 [Schizophyllum commune Loenen D]|nr:hypothetical protein K525DRAFT_363758 [Schizophyllum commune Loenen D]
MPVCCPLSACLLHHFDSAIYLCCTSLSHRIRIGYLVTAVAWPCDVGIHIYFFFVHGSMCRLCCLRTYPLQ